MPQCHDLPQPVAALIPSNGTCVLYSLHCQNDEQSLWGREEMTEILSLFMCSFSEMLGNDSLRKSDRDISYDITYIESKNKKDTDELIYETENRLIDLEKELWLPAGRVERRID